MKNTFLTLLIVAGLISPIIAQKKIKKNDLTELRNLMAGSFSSEAQAFRDSNYYDIRLQMKPIWTERSDGYWFYVEQAMIKTMDKPYRQRVYHLYKYNDTCLVSQVYTLKDPLRFAGEWKNEKALSSLTVDSLEAKEGCAIYLNKISSAHYSGSTPGKQCLSTLRGATYATSEVSVIKGLLISWDRGWDENNNQVWGATAGGYQFVKLKDW